MLWVLTTANKYNLLAKCPDMLYTSLDQTIKINNMKSLKLYQIQHLDNYPCFYNLFLKQVILWFSITGKPPQFPLIHVKPHQNNQRPDCLKKVVM